MSPMIPPLLNPLFLLTPMVPSVIISLFLPVCCCFPCLHSSDTVKFFYSVDKLIYLVSVAVNMAAAAAAAAVILYGLMNPDTSTFQSLRPVCRQEPIRIQHHIGTAKTSGSLMSSYCVFNLSTVKTFIILLPRSALLSQLHFGGVI